MHPNAKAMLEEHLPYELEMLQGAYEFLQNPAYAHDRRHPFARNAAIECFWLHARNLIDFLTQASSATLFETRGAVSAYHFTTKSYDPDGIGRDINDDINQSITHLQYGRKSQAQPTLDVFTMLRVKQHIERQIKKFEDALTEEAGKVWVRRTLPETIEVTTLDSATNATTFARLFIAN
jgi:hypothetical protein